MTETLETKVKTCDFCGILGGMCFDCYVENAKSLQKFLNQDYVQIMTLMNDLTIQNFHGNGGFADFDDLYDNFDNENRNETYHHIILQLVDNF